MEITSSFLDTWAKLSGPISTSTATHKTQAVYKKYKLHTKTTTAIDSDTQRYIVLSSGTFHCLLLYCMQFARHRCQCDLLCTDLLNQRETLAKYATPVEADATNASVRRRCRSFHA